MKNRPMRRNRQQRRYPERLQPERLTYSVPQAAHVIGISPSMAWRLVSTGELRVRRIGKRVVITHDAVEEFLRGES